MTATRSIHRLATATGCVAALITVRASTDPAGRHLGAQAAALRTPVGLANSALAALGAAIGAWIGALVAAVAAVVGLAGSMPVGRLGRSRPTAASGIRLTTANVLVGNDRFAELLEQLVADDPDVLLLQEITPEHAVILDALQRSHPEWSVQVDPETGFAGWATISRFAVRSQGRLDDAVWPVSWSVIDHPITPIRVVNVHAPAPLTAGDHQRWERYMEILAEFADGSVPTVMAGDFNATADHRPMRGLLRAGFTDAFDRVGRGWGATWPDSRFAVPLLRLDHVLVDAALTVVRLGSVALPGSDHRGLTSVIGPVDGDRDS